jgi:hypothetical protein
MTLGVQMAEGEINSHIASGRIDLACLPDLSVSADLQ